MKYNQRIVVIKPRISLRSIQATTIGCLIIYLTGCMVGPDFQPAPVPNTQTYTHSPLPNKTVSTKHAGAAGQSQYFVNNLDIPGSWWVLFKSPQLNYLINMGLSNSPNLAAAKAALYQAQENYHAQVASSLFPSLSAQFNGTRQLFSSTGIGSEFPNSTFNLYNASVSVSYTLDFFGGARRQIEALAAQVDYQRFQVTAAKLALTANIATTAITVASLKEQIKATREIIQLQTDQLTIMKKQFSVGAISGVDVLSQETQLAQTRATLSPLEQNLAQKSHALAVLVGVLPNQRCLPQLDLNQLHLPNYLPVSLPSNFVYQRPDIRAAEALLHAASAQVGVATANLYPQITLNGNYGWQSTLLPELFFNGQNLVWSYGGSLLQPIFNAGALRAKKRAAVDAFQQTVAQYRQTVLLGFQNVADTLVALKNDADLLKAQTEAELSAKKILTITQQQFLLGGVSYLALLTAQRQYQQTLIKRIQAQAARYTDTAALFQALGGGWWNVV
jgi:NodT family efflux transporter outer membrane factor (OMF) lipoprotein